MKNPALEESFLFTPEFNQDGLIPAIVKDSRSGEVLMLAWMNKSALDQTLATGKVHFWSRSRKKLWLKGKTSGNYLLVKEIYTDCDQDAILIAAELQGTAACHTGRKSCFYRRIAEDGSSLIFSEA